MNEHIEQDSKTLFGFFAYLMSDLVLFAALFAVYAVLRTNAFGGAAVGGIFNIPSALAETLILLTSSLTCVLALFAARKGSVRGAIIALSATLALGAAFLTMEFSEFARLVAAGNGPSKSGFLSSYFTLVGTHGLHIVVGLLWCIALIIAIARKGFTRGTLRKLALFALFWHFLEIVWIFIFTIVYLMGIL